MAIRIVQRKYGGPHLSDRRVPGLTSLDFVLPPELEASEPPEARGLARDEVGLMVSYQADDRIVHARFRELPDFLSAGDVLVINTSGTMNAALRAVRADGMLLELHLSTRLPAGLWIVEVRRPDGHATQPFADAAAGETLRLPGGASVTLHTPYAGLSETGSLLRKRRRSGAGGGDGETGRKSKCPTRLWIASLDLPGALDEYLAEHGFPIRYGYVRQGWPAEYYQTVYVTETGSAEMPSAGRPFTPDLITRLVARGVQVAPLLLHTGVASLEDHEPPYEEFYRVPLATARLVNAARAAGGRVIAVGTTVVRALETVTDADGTAHPGEGWTRLVITPGTHGTPSVGGGRGAVSDDPVNRRAEPTHPCPSPYSIAAEGCRGLRAVDALLTGLHEPRATHLAMLAALAGREHLELTYAEALRERYLWHEFGDRHLILP